MDYISQINDFVDGTLDPELEGELFMALASSDELRGELKQFIELESTARNDAEAFAPSAAATLGIFSQLGINTAIGTGAAAATVAATSQGSGIMAWLSRMSSYLVTGAVSASLAFVAAFGIFNDGGGSDNLDITSATPAFTALMPAVHDTVIREVEVPVVTNYTVITAPSAPVIAIEENMGQEDNLEEDNNSRQYVPVVLTSRLPLKNLSYLKRRQYEPEQRSPGQIVMDAINMGDMYEKSSWSFEYNKSQYWHANGTNVLNPNIPESTNPVFENSALSLLFDLTEDFSLGCNLRNEFIYQKYNGREDGHEYEYKQNTSYNSLSLMARYNLLNVSVLNDNLVINLNAQLDLGTFGSLSPSKLAAGGWLTRGGFMLELAPSDIISIITSVEYGSYFYDYQGVNFDSQKFGFNTGLRINFMRMIK